MAISDKKINDWIKRPKIPIYTVYKTQDNKWDTSEKKEVSYKYYICDYCNSAIIIRKKFEEREGGEFTLPLTRLRRGTARVVAHNCCLNKMLKELDLFFEEKEKEAKK